MKFFYMRKNYQYFLKKLLKRDENIFLPINGIYYPYPTRLLDKRDDLRIKSNGEIVIKDSWKKFWECAFAPGDTVIDIGAYIGLVSIPLAFFGGIVHSFEGSPRNYSRVKEICKPIRQIKVHPAALSDTKKQCHTRFNDCIGNEHPEQDIKYVVYDDYAKENKIKDPKFVKIDIEGMESIALKGMKNLLENVRPAWQIEYHSSLEYHYSEYPGFVDVENGGFDFNTFRKLKYSIFDENFNKVDKFEKHINYFVFPNERLPEF